MNRLFYVQSFNVFKFNREGNAILGFEKLIHHAVSIPQAMLPAVNACKRALKIAFEIQSITDLI